MQGEIDHKEVWKKLGEEGIKLDRETRKEILNSSKSFIEMLMSDPQFVYTPRKKQKKAIEIFDLMCPSQRKSMCDEMRSRNVNISQVASCLSEKSICDVCEWKRKAQQIFERNDKKGRSVEDIKKIWDINALQDTLEIVFSEEAKSFIFDPKIPPIKYQHLCRNCRKVLRVFVTKEDLKRFHADLRSVDEAKLKANWYQRIRDIEEAETCALLMTNIHENNLLAMKGNKKILVGTLLDHFRCLEEEKCNRIKKQEMERRRRVELKYREKWDAFHTNKADEKLKELQDYAYLQYESVTR